MGIRQAGEDIAFMNALFTTAESEAHRLGDELPGAEHLLLAALMMDDGSGRDAFRSAGGDANALSLAITDLHAEALRAVGVHAQEAAAIDAITAGPYRTSASAQEAFQRAAELSKARRPHRLRTADVVRAVAERESGTAARAIASLGVERAALIAAAATAVTSSS